MNIREVIDKLESMALYNNKELYIKSNNYEDDGVLNVVFFCPVSRRSQCFRIEIDKFSPSYFSYINMLLMSRIKPEYMNYVEADVKATKNYYALRYTRNEPPQSKKLSSTNRRLLLSGLMELRR